MRKLSFNQKPCLCGHHLLRHSTILPNARAYPAFNHRDAALITIGDDPLSSSMGPCAFAGISRVLSRADAIVVWVGGFNPLIRFGIDMMGMNWRTVEIQTQPPHLEEWEHVLPEGTPCFRILPTNDWNFDSPGKQLATITGGFCEFYDQLTRRNRSELRHSCRLS